MSAPRQIAPFSKTLVFGYIERVESTYLMLNVEPLPLREAFASVNVTVTAGLRPSADHDVLRP
jgi:hypothetical protein